MKKHLIVSTAAGLALSSAALAKAPTWANSKTVKCAGVVKAGANHCGANGHACAGQAAKDNDPNEWIYAPKEVCEKIAGAKVITASTTHMKKGHTK